MAKPEQDSSWIGPFVIVLAILCLGAIWMFSPFFGLDLPPVQVCC